MVENRKSKKVNDPTCCSESWGRMRRMKRGEEGQCCRETAEVAMAAKRLQQFDLLAEEVKQHFKEL